MIKLVDFEEYTGWRYDIQDTYDVYSGVFYDSIYKFEVNYRVKYDESGGEVSYFHPNTLKEVNSIGEAFKGLKMKNETQKEAKKYFINQVLSATEDNLTEGNFKVLSYRKEKKRGRL